MTCRLVFVSGRTCVETIKKLTAEIRFRLAQTIDSSDSFLHLWWYIDLG